MFRTFIISLLKINILCAQFNNLCGRNYIVPNAHMLAYKVFKWDLFKKKKNTKPTLSSLISPYTFKGLVCRQVLKF